MKITLSIIKADIGSIGGHICPSKPLIERVKEFVAAESKDLVSDFFVSHTGDDIAILFAHYNGEGYAKLHKLAWDAFLAGTQVAKKQGLYGAGQDLLKDSFSGNVKGMGPAVAEMEFEERPNEPFVMFAADKTDPGAYNLPLYLMFCDPMYNSGLILSPNMAKGFRFVIMDVANTQGDKVIELSAPEDLYDIAASCCTSRLHNIAGKYTGKDDPVMLVRCQGAFPATGEVLAPFNIGHYVAGFMRGSHNGPLMPVKMNSSVSFFDGPPVVSATGFCVHEGKLTDPADCFDHPYWDYIRTNVSRQATELRQQGFSGAAMLPYSELEYGGIVKKMEKLEPQFKIRE
jgi:fructose 1,6-bisphosphate aldolase/phosphatase